MKRPSLVLKLGGCFGAKRSTHTLKDDLLVTQYSGREGSKDDSIAVRKTFCRFFFKFKLELQHFSCKLVSAFMLVQSLFQLGGILIVELVIRLLANSRDSSA